jgi:Pretoxin HINT domain
VEGRGWVEAGKLVKGAKVSAKGGDFTSLTGVEKKPGKRTVYNFEVENTHSYFVGDREKPSNVAPLWVHNY